MPSGPWAYASLFNSTVSYFYSSAVTYELVTYVCINPSGCGPSSGPAPSDWSEASNLTGSLLTDGPVTAKCGLTNAIPNPQTGMCETSPPSGPGTECVNPCIRLQNGRLAVTRDTSSCRIFNTATSGGLVTGTCQTNCPNACVELWETCPPGSAPLTTLMQTKTPTDLLSLTGPYLQDGSLNNLWPANYAYYDKQGNAIIGKPYTECYSFNTSFCDLPGARQESVKDIINPTNGLITIRGSTSCYAACPVGTFQSQIDSKLCLFNPIHSDTMATYSPDTPVQQVFCNPQYFNPAYWAEDVSGPFANEAQAKAGVQKGCRSIPLPSKALKTCELGTSPVINDFFNLEWCVPDCPTGFFFDLSHSNCVASCNGTLEDNGISTVPIYLDYVDFYIRSDRCLDGQDCKMNNVQGMCPAVNNTKKLFSTVQNGSCPRGMLPGNEDFEENPAFCYDECMEGYERVASCPNLAKTCSPTERTFMCRAKCPDISEGLGPWKTVDQSPLFICDYNYPGPVPNDPNLWVNCPSDGRYDILQYLPTDVSVTVTTAIRQTPVCVRKTYLRNVTCPIGSNNDGASCQEACDSSDLVVTLGDGSVVCQSSSQSPNHFTDWDAIADSYKAKPTQRSRVLVRSIVPRGLGQDPQAPDEPTPLPRQNIFILVGIILLSLFIFIFILRSFLKA